MGKMAYFGLKLGQDLGNWATHPYREFRGVPLPPGQCCVRLDQFVAPFNTTQAVRLKTLLLQYKFEFCFVQHRFEAKTLRACSSDGMLQYWQVFVQFTTQQIVSLPTRIQGHEIDLHTLESYQMKTNTRATRLSSGETLDMISVRVLY